MTTELIVEAAVPHSLQTLKSRISIALVVFALIAAIFFAVSKSNVSGTDAASASQERLYGALQLCGLHGKDVINN